MATHTINEGSEASAGGSIVTTTEAYLELGLTAPTPAEVNIVAAAITKAEGAIKRYLRYDPVQRRRTEFYPMGDHGFKRAAGIWEANDTQAYLREAEGAAGGEIILKHLPVRAIVAMVVHVDSDGRSDTTDGAFVEQKDEGSDFWPNYDGFDSGGFKICGDGIIRHVGAWPRTPGSIRVAYTAGYSTGEFRSGDGLVDASPIWDAALDETIRRAKKVFLNMKQTEGWVAGTKKSEKLGDYSYTTGGPMGGSTGDTAFGGSMDMLSESKEKLREFVNWGFELGS